MSCRGSNVEQEDCIPGKTWNSPRRTQVSLRAQLPRLAEALGFPLSPLRGPLTIGISQGYPSLFVSALALPRSNSALQHLSQVQPSPFLLTPARRPGLPAIIPVANALHRTHPAYLIALPPYSKYCGLQIFLLLPQGKCSTGRGQLSGETGFCSCCRFQTA